MATGRLPTLLSLLVGALTTAGCMGDADTEGAGAVLFSASTPRAEILTQFAEVLSWTDVRVDNRVVPGQNRCVLTVAVSDTANAEAIRTAFLPIAEASATNLCPAMVVLRPVPYTRAQVEAAQRRIDSLLAGKNTGAKTILTREGEVVVEVKNFPAVERAHAALAADTLLPAGMVTDVRPRTWMREAENPREPPLEAFTAVLVDLYRKNASPAATIGLLRSSLPRGFTERNLAGLPMRIVDDAAAASYLIRLGGSTQLEDGVFVIDAIANSSDADTNAAPKPVGVDCVQGECFLVDVLPPPTRSLP